MSGYCPDCGNTMCLCDDVTKAIYPLRVKMELLENQNLNFRKLLQASIDFLKIVKSGQERLNNMPMLRGRFTEELKSYTDFIAILEKEIEENP